jgi:hypothetical protein
MDNVIFISGPHGVGKTTTINEVLNRDERFEIFNPVSDDHRNPYRENVFMRQCWRLNKYYLEFEELRVKSPDSKILIVDRCIFDWLCYTKAFQKLGWLKCVQYRKLIRLCREYFELFDLFDRGYLPLNKSVSFFPRRNGMLTGSRAGGTRRKRSGTRVTLNTSRF